ncbi:MAG: transposase [bacterium]|nr:transposase [bacterium]
MDIFLDDQDKETYMALLREQSKKAGLKIVGYCLMANHIHLLVIPRTADSLRAAISETHRLYTRYFNFRTKARGHLFQQRFLSCPLDDQNFIAAARYVERNPLRLKMVKKPSDYPWSSARYHLGLDESNPLIGKIDSRMPTPKEWKKWLQTDPQELDLLRRHFRVGRPLGSESFMKKAEKVTGRVLMLKPAGRPKKN